MKNTPRGTYDIQPGEIEYYQEIERIAFDLFEEAGYKEIRTPIIEYTDLYNRSLGKQTDIISKEMYEFEDKGGRKLVLRPEGTAAIARSYSQQGEKYQKYYYSGSMFRYERPQAGRQRQFNQIGIESFGNNSPLADIETITLATQLLDKLNIPFTLTINSLGDKTARDRFTADLQDYIMRNQGIDIYEEWGESSTEILKALDSTDDNWIVESEYPPELEDFLNKESKERFDTVQKYLNLLSIPFEVDPYLVRGLDYYNDTIFEISTKVNSKDLTLIGGGRYNELLKEIGSEPTPAIGFATGVERIILALKEYGYTLPIQSPDYYFIVENIETMALARIFLERGARIVIDSTEGSFKKKMERARKSNAKFAVSRGNYAIQQKDFTLFNLKDAQDIRVVKMSDFLSSKSMVIA